MWFWISCASIALNITLLIYARWLIKTISAINEDVDNITEIIQEFSEHVKGIHELEMFYGDQTLKSLMDHATHLTKTLAEVDLVLNETEEEKDQDAKEET